MRFLKQIKYYWFLPCVRAFLYRMTPTSTTFNRIPTHLNLSAKANLLDLLEDKNVQENEIRLSDNQRSSVEEAILALELEMSIKHPTAHPLVNGYWGLVYHQLPWPSNWLDDELHVLPKQPRAEIQFMDMEDDGRCRLYKKIATLEERSPTHWQQIYLDNEPGEEPETRELFITYLDEDVLIMHDENDFREVLKRIPKFKHS